MRSIVVGTVTVLLGLLILALITYQSVWDELGRKAVEQGIIP